MLISIFLFFLFYNEVRSGELLFAKIPSSIELKNDGTVHQSVLPDLFSAALGFSINRESNWKGMNFKNPFNFPEVLVVLNVIGINSLGENDESIKKYILSNDESSQITWRKLKKKLLEEHLMKNSKIHYVDSLSAPNNDLNANLENSLSYQYMALVKKINNLNERVKEIKKSNEVPLLYWYNIKSLPLLNLNSEDDFNATKKAQNLIFNAFLSMANKFGSVYNNMALVVAIVNDETAHTRQSRSIADEGLESKNVNEDLKNNVYDPNFPVIFNIILWLTCGLILSLLAISVFIASMDPGRDSIIYRMTSNRVKKDS